MATKWTKQAELVLINHAPNNTLLQLVEIMSHHGYKVTKCALIGKCKRLGIKFQHVVIRKKEPKKHTSLIWKLDHSDDAVHLANIKACQCHFPLSELHELTKLYCGATTKQGVDYCEKHLKVMYPSKPKRATFVPNIRQEAVY